jgi:DNA-binding NtrC family response regulator
LRDLTLLVVDDDPLIHESVAAVLPKGWRKLSAQSPSALPPRGFHCALVDVHLTGRLEKTEGIEVIQKLLKTHPFLEVIAMSGHLDRPTMEACIKAGASRFLPKPLSPDELELLLTKVAALFEIRGGEESHTTRTWIGSSAASQSILKQIAQLKNEGGPVLIEGETGTGKEVTAQLLHLQEKRGPFISLNVSALPENLFESEIFGHVKGAFTGAERDKMGLVEAAHGGDLFLDEIEALPLNLQAKLLRFLETGEGRRVGAQENYFVETRVIAASNQSLQKMVDEGNFREDLLWRLSGKKISLPPLRERLEDLKELAEHFLSQGSSRRLTLDEEAVGLLKSHSWPGNLRELKRVIEQASLYAPLPYLRAEDLKSWLGPQSSKAASSSPQWNGRVDLKEGLSPLLAGFERHLIKSALEEYKDIDEVARTLQISRSSLYKKIKDHDIDWKP